MLIRLAAAATTVLLLIHAPHVLANVDETPTLPAGDFRVTAAAGAVSMSADWTWGMEASVRAGLPWRLELALPLALAIDLYSNDEGSGLVLAGGAVDMWFTDEARFIWTPAAVLAAQLRVASGASLRAALDFTGVEDGFGAEDHPWWLRGSLALMIGMGPYLTVAAGLSYQRQMFGGDPPVGTRQTGWVGDARVSIGAVRSQPFEDLPTIAVHATSWLDVVALARVDIDSDSDTTDARFLAGLRLKLSLLGAKNDRQ